MRSTARPPAAATLLVMSFPGQRNWWSSTEGSLSTPLSPATEEWCQTYQTKTYSDTTAQPFFETLGNFNTFGKLIPLTPPPLLRPDFHHGGVIAQVQPRAADGQQIIFCFFLSVFLTIPVGFLCLAHLHTHFMVVTLKTPQSARLWIYQAVWSW